MVDTLMWIVMAVALIGNILVIKKNRNGFMLWFVTNWLWVAYDLDKGAHAQAAMMLIYAGLAAWGWIAWKKDP
jgi:nicotinamide riboside transporter PnuC